MNIKLLIKRLIIALPIVSALAKPGGTYTLTGNEKGLAEIIIADMKKFPDYYQGESLNGYISKFKTENKIGKRSLKPGDELRFPATLASLKLKSSTETVDTPASDVGKPTAKQRVLIEEAERYYTGTGCEKDVRKALSLYAQACEISRYPRAVGGMGTIYLFNPELKNIPLGIELTTEAANGGDYTACFRLADFYGSPYSRNPDAEKAIKYGLMAEAISPDGTRTLSALSYAYEMAKQYDKAMEYQEALISSYPFKGNSYHQGAIDRLEELKVKKDMNL